MIGLHELRSGSTICSSDPEDLYEKGLRFEDGKFGLFCFGKTIQDIIEARASRDVRTADPGAL